MGPLIQFSDTNINSNLMMSSDSITSIVPSRPVESHQLSRTVAFVYETEQDLSCCNVLPLYGDFTP